MNAAAGEKLRAILSQGRWDRAVALLEQLGPEHAENLLMSIPYEQQQVLFRRMPLDFAARLVEILPYYHAYVLLHSRPIEEMTAIVDRMQPGVRLQFFDELPEEAWQRLMDELARKQPASNGEVPIEAAVPTVTEPVEPIIEARRIEKSFARPDGGQIQVIAPTDLC